MKDHNMPGRMPEDWCPLHFCSEGLCEDWHDNGALVSQLVAEPGGNYTSMITREGNGSDAGSEADPLVREPSE